MNKKPKAKRTFSATIKREKKKHACRLRALRSLRKQIRTLGDIEPGTLSRVNYQRAALYLDRCDDLIREGFGYGRFGDLR